MECLHKIAVYKRDKRETVEVPCGQCIACRLNRAREWQVRIMHEKKMHKESCFLTLTYDQEHAPWVSDFRTTLYKPDVQGFMKRLRSYISPVKVRFYLCGEYGEKKGRAHYHVCLMGFRPTDLVFYKHTSAGDLWISPTLNKLWSNGHVIVANLDYDSAGYVARYCTKLLTGKASEWYKERNLVPEFALMSRRPGIGATWLEKFGNEVKEHHSVVAKGREMAPPRYYKDKIYDEMDRDIVRSRVVDKIVSQFKQARLDAEVDYQNFLRGIDTSLNQERVETREKTILAKMKKRGG